MNQRRPPLLSTPEHLHIPRVLPNRGALGMTIGFFASPVLAVGYFKLVSHAVGETEFTTLDNTGRQEPDVLGLTRSDVLLHETGVAEQ